MKQITKLILFHCTVLACATTSFGQEDSLLSKYDFVYNKNDIYSSVLTPKVFDINRMPINISFIKSNDKYVGFIIAGHAYKDICQIASMGVKTLLDSLGYERNTVFSYGVGFDLRTSTWNWGYHDKLKELEKTFKELEIQDFTQVHVGYTTERLYKGTLQMITENLQLARTGFEDNASVNRVIFRYKSPGFPMPMPFYNGERVITFKIPKSEIGQIPNVKVFELDIIRNALEDIEKALRINNNAIQQIADYNPITYTSSFGIMNYPVTISSSLKDEVVKDYLFQFDSTKALKITDRNTGALINYYSIGQLKRMCNNGQEYLELQGNTKKVNTCDAASKAEMMINEMYFKKKELLAKVKRINKYLLVEENKLIGLQNKFIAIKPKGDSLIVIDAFLRGWPFETENKVLNAQLERWYDKRLTIWKNIMIRNPEYKDRLRMKVKLVKDVDNIAGIFQSDDVFFSVHEEGSDYIITPFKILGDDFVQVIDRKTQVSQFFSMNNFRLIQL